MCHFILIKDSQLKKKSRNLVNCKKETPEIYFKKMRKAVFRGKKRQMVYLAQFQHRGRKFKLSGKVDFLFIFFNRILYRNMLMRSHFF